MIRGCSHAVFATSDVARMMRFVEAAFDLRPAFERPEFGELVLASGFRLAFFRAVGPAAVYFDEASARSGSAIGVTVDDVDACHRRLALQAKDLAIRLSGPPQDHPWGERSFLLVDPDGNRWEIAQSARADGMLPDRGGA